MWLKSHFSSVFTTEPAPISSLKYEKKLVLKIFALSSSRSWIASSPTIAYSVAISSCSGVSFTGFPL